MANLSQTVANIKWTGGTEARKVTAGGTVTRGMGAYQDSADNKYKQGSANAVNTAAMVGVFLTDGYDGSDALLAVAGSQLNIGATTTSGVLYVLSPTSGGFCALNDAAMVTGKFPTAAFWGNGTAIVTLICNAAGYAI